MTSFPLSSGMDGSRPASDARSPAPTDPGGFDVDGELARLFGDGVRPLHLEQALFDAILAGWVRQQRARLLSERTIGPRERLVRRLLEHLHRPA